MTEQLEQALAKCKAQQHTQADVIVELRMALVEIRQLHQPTSTDYGTRAFCVLCGAADGSWPCTTRLIIDEALGPTRATCRPCKGVGCSICHGTGWEA